MFFRLLPSGLLGALLVGAVGTPVWAESESQSLKPSSESMQAARLFWQTHPSPAVQDALEELSSADWLGEGPHSIQAGLAAISLTQQGRGILADVYPLYEEKKLAIVSTHSIEARRLAGRVDLGGMYHESTVYIEDRAALLAFAATLFHELVHARSYLKTDAGNKDAEALASFNNLASALSRAKAQGSEITKAQMDQWRAAQRAVTPILLATEHQAYLAQNAFLAEFEQFAAGFGPLLEELTARRYWVAYPLREFDFQYLMSHRNGANLPRAEVEAYLRQHPFNGSRR